MCGDGSPDHIAMSNFCICCYQNISETPTAEFSFLKFWLHGVSFQEALQSLTLVDKATTTTAAIYASKDCPNLLSIYIFFCPFLPIFFPLCSLFTVSCSQFLCHTFARERQAQSVWALGSLGEGLEGFQIWRRCRSFWKQLLLSPLWDGPGATQGPTERRNLQSYRIKSHFECLSENPSGVIFLRSTYPRFLIMWWQIIPITSLAPVFHQQWPGQSVRGHRAWYTVKRVEVIHI